MFNVSVFYILYIISLTGCYSVHRDPAQIRDSDGEEVEMDVSTLGWKLTFSDEFLKKEDAISTGAPSDCFEGPVSCLYHSWKRKDCLPEHQYEGLKDLNRCNWTVWGMYNWMDWDAKPSEGINSFHPSQVKVENGYLHLSAARSSYPVEKIRCKVNFRNPEYDNDEMYSTDCLVHSGGVQSSNFWRNNREVGFSQEYGRFEVRAKLSFGTGSWPAIWMLPATHPVDDEEAACGWWPYRGEIDLVEAWDDKPDTVVVSYHDGNCSKKVKTNSNRSITSKEIFNDMNKEERQKTFYKDFHTYAIEWDKNVIRFYIDDFFVYAISDSVYIDAKHFETANHGKKAGKILSEIAKGPFHILLNNTIQPKNFDYWKNLKPGELGGEDNQHIIDYVRVYRRCTSSDDQKDCNHVKVKNSSVNHPANQILTLDLNVYPNPVRVHESFNVRFKTPVDCLNLNLLIKDITGKDLFEKKFSDVQAHRDNYESINTTGFVAGLYFVVTTYSGCSPDHSSGVSTLQFMVI